MTAPAESPAWSFRPVARIVRALPAADGAGVRLHRSLGSPAMPMLDPFLLLDEMKSEDSSDYVAGFPNHPHRGFETVTYMIAGRMQHKDSVGNTGNLSAGSIQWMTAGRGIVHSEMPQQVDGLLWGFQMWVNLPRKDKMRAPRYQDIAAEAVPEVELPRGGLVRVLAGASHGVAGAVEGIVTQPLLLDVHLGPGSELVQPVPARHNAFAYVFDGAGHFDEAAGQPAQRAATANLAGDRAHKPVEARHLVVFGEGDAVRARAEASSVRFLLAAAQPIKEPVARYGPFVMSTREELIEAFNDFETGRLVG